MISLRRSHSIRVGGSSPVACSQGQVGEGNRYRKSSSLAIALFLEVVGDCSVLYQIV